MPKPQFNDRKEALSGLELEKVLYDASERLSSQILSGISPERGLNLTIDVWELENLLLPALNAAVNEIRIFDEMKAEDFSFELKRRRNTLAYDLVNLLIECLRDAYRDDVAVEYAATKVVSIKFLNKVENLSVVKKEFTNRVYEVLRHLLGK
uniref:Uncharacterized protein n=1 Tax=Candidatus Methanosuratincola petrocarbonis (ex Vanwonterghem et al. 2016) TaxID=1867261 RepID=A0A7J3V065_9CREN